MNRRTPPRFWSWLLATALPEPDRTEILGDMTEGFGIRCRETGHRAARRWFRRQTGGILWTRTREQARHMFTLASRRHRPPHTGRLFMSRRWLDMRYAVRGFRRSMGFAATVLATIALGIGATTMVFAFVHSILLTPLPYPNPERVVGVWHAAPGLGIDQLPMSRGMYFVYGEHSRTLESIALYSPFRANVTVGENPERLAVVGTTHELFTILGGAPRLGRLLIADDDRVDAPPVVVVSHGLWARGFGSDPAIVGRQLRIDGRAHEIVGVLPAGFRVPAGAADAFISAKPDPSSPWTGGFNAPGVARLAEGTTPAEANAELASLFPILDQRFANFSVASAEENQLRPDLHYVMDDVVGTVRPALWTLLGTVGFVLLIACANVANLILIRAEARNREMALRRALGANRGAVAAFFFTESAVLAGLGTSVGLAFAWVAIRLLVRFGPGTIPRIDEVGIDPVTIGFAAGLGGAAAALFGAIPAARFAASESGRALQDGARGSTLGRGGHRMRTLFVGSQTAFALILLVGSGLLVKSFWQLRHVALGFTAEPVLTFRLSLPGSSYPGGDARATFYRSLLERIEAIPGVRMAGVTSRLPLDENNLSQDPLLVPGGTGGDAVLPITGMLMASPDYFRSMGIGLLAGRELTWADHDTRSGAVVVSETLARAYWPNEDPIGKRVRHTTAGPETWSTVVGVVEDIRLRGITQAPGPDVYYALQPVFGAGNEWLSIGMSVIVNTVVPPLTVAPAVRDIVRELDQHVAISAVQPMASIVDRATAQTAFTMVILAAAALIGLFLGAVGIYGVVAYVTTQRTREIGVRIALGADGGRVRGMVLRQGAAVTGLGIIVGLIASVALTRLLQSQLYDVSPTDPITFGTVSVLLLTVSLTATYVPARRAARTDPVTALRTE